MNRLAVCCLLVPVALAVPFFPLHAAESASVVGSGARAMGMGGAFIAVADDATAISWNPAGLTRLDEPEAGIAVTFGSGSWDLAFYDPEDAFDVDVEARLSLNFASVVYPFALGDRHAVGALAFRKYWDYTSKYTIGFPEFDDEWVLDRSGGVNTITPAIAVQLSPKLSLGATASIAVGGVKSEESSPIGEWNASWKFSGFTAELGLLADVSPKVRVGLVGSIPWTLKWTDWEIDGDSNYEDNEQDIPALFGVGIAAKPMPTLTLAFDVRHQPWSKMKYDGEVWDTEDATVLRGGAEYLLIGEKSVIPLRAGYYVEPTMERVEDYHDYYTGQLVRGEQIKNKGLTVGVGVILGKITLDACYARVTQVFDDEYGKNTMTHNAFTLSTVVHLGKETH